MFWSRHKLRTRKNPQKGRKIYTFVDLATGRQHPHPIYTDATAARGFKVLFSQLGDGNYRAEEINAIFEGDNVVITHKAYRVRLAEFVRRNPSLRTTPGLPALPAFAIYDYPTNRGRPRTANSAAQTVMGFLKLFYTTHPDVPLTARGQYICTLIDDADPSAGAVIHHDGKRVCAIKRKRTTKSSTRPPES